MTDYRAMLLDFVRSLRVISTHNHHLPDAYFENVDLKFILSNSYTNWVCPPPDIADADDCARYIRRYGCNSFFRWLFEALESLYGLPITPGNMVLIDEAVRRAYKEPDYHLSILTDACRFERVINERQPDPGSDLSHPELFSPSFRCDSFFKGYLMQNADPNGFKPYSLFEDTSVDSIEAYLEQVRLAISRKKQAGCVALKVAMAYERPIDFKELPIERARAAFNNPNATPGEIRDFGDVVMFAIARFAAELDMPLQIHTGLGGCRATNPIALVDLIEFNPDTRFHLLHGGFPWFDDTYALLARFRNVWSDTCWIPYLSTHAAKDYIITALEVSDAHRLTWGCDTWVGEDSLGARFAIEHALSGALAHMIADGALGIDEATYIAGSVLCDNAAELFGLSGCGAACGA